MWVSLLEAGFADKFRYSGTDTEIANNQGTGDRAPNRHFVYWTNNEYLSGTDEREPKESDQFGRVAGWFLGDDCRVVCLNRSAAYWRSHGARRYGFVDLLGC